MLFCFGGDADMLFRESPEKFWNLIASRYAASPIADMAAYRTKIAKIKSYLNPEDMLLDIGCGTGTQCADLAGDVKQVTGIDISSKLLAIAEQRRAERKLENVRFQKASLFDVEFQADSFDVVMAFYVLHFFPDIDAACSRVHALLRPGGLFIAETACMGDKNKIAGRLLGIAGKLGFLPRINLLTNERLEQALERAGFDMLDKVRFSETNEEFTMFARKPC